MVGQMGHNHDFENVERNLKTQIINHRICDLGYCQTWLAEIIILQHTQHLLTILIFNLSLDDNMSVRNFPKENKHPVLGVRWFTMCR